MKSTRQVHSERDQLLQKALERRLKKKKAVSSNADQIPSDRTASKWPLSFAQERLWFLSELAPESVNFNQLFSLRLKGSFNVNAFEQVLRTLVARHESFRTRIIHQGGEQWQQIDENLAVNLKYVDLIDEDMDSSERILRCLARMQTRKRFSLEEGPVWDVALLRLSETHHVFLMTYHHIIIDGGSLIVFTEELKQLYDTFLKGDAPCLGALDLRYVDYSAWNRRQFEAGKKDVLSNYWKRKLKELPYQFTLPPDIAYKPEELPKGDCIHLELSQKELAALKALANSNQVTLYMVLLAAFKLLLFRYTERSDVVVGTDVATRNLPELKPIIGLFINRLVLRTDCSGCISFSELLKRVGETVWEALEHREIPFQKLLEYADVHQNRGLQPLFQIGFDLQNFDTVEGSLRLRGEGQLKVEWLQLDFETATNDIFLSLKETESGLAMRLAYRADRYFERTAKRILNDYKSVLNAVVEAPNTSLLNFNFWSITNEQCGDINTEHAIIEEGKPLQSIHGCFQDIAKTCPDAIALIQDENHVTFRELDRRSNQLAWRIRRLGVEPESRVGIFLERSPEMVVALLGVLKSEAMYVPLDPNYPQKRLQVMLEDADLSLVLTENALLERLPKPCPLVETIDLPHAQYLHGPTSPLPLITDAHGLAAYMIYTSGSTGKPRGVIGLHASTMNRFQWMWKQYPFGPEERCCQKTTLSFVDSVWEIFGPLLRGISLVLIPHGAVRELDRFKRIVHKHHISRIVLVPSLLRQMVNRWDVLGAYFDSLRFWVSSGETLSSNLVSEFFERMPESQLINLYGSSEVAADVTAHEITGADGEHEIPIGQTIDNCRMTSVDSQGHVLPDGVRGELCIGGDCLARGYFNRPGLTAEKFIPDINGRAGGVCFRSGDYGSCLPDGNWLYHGRIDEQIKLRGCRIEFGEIEFLLNRHSEVAQSAVAFFQSSEGDPQLIAYVVAKEKLVFERSEQEKLSLEHLSVWEEVYQETVGNDPTMNVAGWNSSYTGKPFSIAEMEEWVEQTIARIRALNPRKVLEIGSGSGMLLFRIAPVCERYVATDYSPEAVQYVDSLVKANAEAFGHVDLKICPAHQLDALEEDTFDTIVLNSVVQYFPHENYLYHVVQECIHRLEPGGSLFVGDVRNLDLLETFHFSVQLDRADAKHMLEAIEWKAHNQARLDSELVISPDFFTSLLTDFPVIESVAVLEKPGQGKNEMNHYRYDVVIKVAEAGTGEDVLEERTLELEDYPGTEVLERYLLEGELDRIVCKRVENARIFEDVCARQLVVSNPDSTFTPVALKEQAQRQAQHSVDSATLRELARHHAYRVESSPLGADGLGFNCVEFYKESYHSRVHVFRKKLHKGTRGSFCNNPTHARFLQGLERRLRHYLQEGLPDFMLPTHIVPIEALPLTPNGKLDRKQLPHPEFFQLIKERTYVAPRLPEHRALVQIWEDVLGKETIGIEDNFFELGGDSILAIQMVSEAQNAGLSVTVQELFKFPTISELTSVSLKRKNETLDAERLEGKDTCQNLPSEYPLTPLQEGILFHSIYHENDASYISQVSCEIHGGLSCEAFKEACEAVVNRHCILKTSFHWEKTKAPFQRVEALIDFPWEERTEEDATFESLLEEERRRGFNLKAAPLFRFVLVRSREQLHQLVWTFHHLLLDGWSLARVFREVSEVYEAKIQNAEARLSPPVPFYRYVQWLGARNFKEAEHYWAAQLKDARALPEFNFRGEQSEASVLQEHDMRELRLEAEEKTRLDAFLQQNGLTLSSLIYGVWGLQLGHYFKQPDVVFGVVVSGRPPELEGYERMVGLLINTLPMRQVQLQDLDCVEWLSQVQQQQAEINTYHYCELSKIQTYAAHEKRSLFESIVVFANYHHYRMRHEALQIPSLRYQVKENYPLILDVAQTPELALRLKFKPDYFNASAIDVWLDNLKHLLEWSVSEPKQTLGTLMQKLNALEQQRKLGTEKQFKNFRLEMLKNRKRK